MTNEATSKTPPKRTRRSVLIGGGILIALFGLEFATNVFSSQVDRVVRFRAMQIAHKPDRLWDNTFFGIPMHQFPADFVTYQQVIWEQKPDVIVETGTYRGGNAAYLASVLMHVKPEGRVVTIDIDPEPWKETLRTNKIPQPIMDRITFIEGDSVGDETLAQVRKLTEDKKVLVILDSLHERDHVRKELELYSPLIPVGGYIIVNDSQLEWAMWKEFWDNGPASGRDDFLGKTDAYVLDESLPKSFIADSRHGYVKRVK